MNNVLLSYFLTSELQTYKGSVKSVIFRFYREFSDIIDECG